VEMETSIDVQGIPYITETKFYEQYHQTTSTQTL